MNDTLALMRRVTWDSELDRLVKERWRVGQCFSLLEVYDFEPRFRRLYPNNAHLRDKLRQTLQHLRDGGVLEFVNDLGTYPRVA